MWRDNPVQEHFSFCTVLYYAYIQRDTQSFLSVNSVITKTSQSMSCRRTSRVHEIAAKQTNANYHATEKEKATGRIYVISFRFNI